MSFLEMPNGFGEESEDPPAEGRPQAEEITALRLRDRKTGRFVAGPGLIQKNVSSVLDAAAWSVPLGWLGVEKRKSRKKKVEHLDPKLSVTLKKKD